MDFIKRIFKNVRARATRYTNKRTLVAAGIVGAFLLFAIVKAIIGGGSAAEDEVAIRQVTVAPAGLVSELNAVFESTGEVKSQAQGDLRAQTAGIITYVNARVGQRVTAGTIIASIENASQRASVAQAQAGVAQAEASFEKVKGGTRTEQLAVLAATTQSAQRSLDEAVTSVRNTLLSAYTTTDTSFTGGVDEIYNDADSANPELVFNSRNNAALIASEHARFLLQATIERHAAASTRTSLLDAEALRTELEKVEDEFFVMKETLDEIITALDGAITSASVTSANITAYKTTANAARTSVLSTLTSLSSARSTLNNAENALTIAKENEAQGVTGAQQEDISAAEAQVESAQATLAQAIAQLEKTRVRAPVTGVVTILTVEPGDFVSAFQDVGLVANNGALEIQTYVSSNAVKRISVGAPALVDGAYEGVITSIAPGIDPVKRQVEVKVALVSDEVTLTHGARVTVKFLSADTAVEPTEDTGALLVPISALKLRGDQSFVFTVTPENILKAIPVELGEVVQASVEVVSGLSRDTQIVLDARGLNDGDEVIVAE